MSHDDLVALVAMLRGLLVDLAQDGPLALARAREDDEAECFPPSVRPGSRGGSEDTGPERYAMAVRPTPLSVARAERMCVELRGAKNSLWKASVAAGGARPAGVDRAKVGSREMTLALCTACDEPAPRPRSGMCDACRQAWKRLPEPKPDRAVFRRMRMARVAVDAEAEAQAA